MPLHGFLRCSSRGRLTTPCRGRRLTLLLLAGCLLPALAAGHSGSGIVVDRLGRIYFVDMVNGIWRHDPAGTLTHLPGPAFHWMALDEGDRFRAGKLPSGPGWEIARIGVGPTLLLASDFPVATGRDGALYMPTQGVVPVQILQVSPSGRSTTVATLPATTARGPLRWVNGLAAAPDGSFYVTDDDAIRRIGSDGRVSVVVEGVSRAGCAPWSEKGAAPAPMLRGLDVDSAGTVYVAATACGSVLRVTPAGSVSVLPRLPGSWAPTGVALFGGDVYVLEFEHPESEERREMLPRVRKITSNGKTAVVAIAPRRPGS